MFQPAQCNYCKHSRGFGFCNAFPKGIPRDIVGNRFDYRLAYPGDRGVRFELAREETGAEYVGLMGQEPDERARDRRAIDAALREELQKLEREMEGLSEEGGGRREPGRSGGGSAAEEHMKKVIAWLRSWPVYWREKEWYYSPDGAARMVREVLETQGRHVLLARPVSPWWELWDAIKWSAPCQWLAVRLMPDRPCLGPLLCGAAPVLDFPAEVALALRAVRLGDYRYKVARADGRYLRYRRRGLDRLFQSEPLEGEYELSYESDALYVIERVKAIVEGRPQPDYYEWRALDLGELPFEDCR
jgi:hypothetical protein